MPQPFRWHVPDDQLDRLGQAHEAEQDALAEPSSLTERLAMLEVRRAEAIAALGGEVAAGRSEPRQLLKVADGSLEARWWGALAPTHLLGDMAARRYALGAALALAPGVVAAAIGAAPDDRGRTNTVIETVSAYGRRLPHYAQIRYTEVAVRDMAEAGLWTRRLARPEAPGLRASR